MLTARRVQVEQLEAELREVEERAARGSVDSGTPDAAQASAGNADQIK